MAELVIPHGGALIDRIVSGAGVQALQDEAATLPAVTMDDWETADFELIATGGASPLTGFLSRADYESVLDTMRLANGVVWPLPFTLAVRDEQAATFRSSQSIALRDQAGQLWGVLDVTDIFVRDPVQEARKVYLTDDASHPGVARLLGRPRTLVGGSIRALPLPAERSFGELRLTPRQLRSRLAERGWKMVAGFHAQRPLHRADEHLTKLALESSDGLVIHAVTGQAAADEASPAVRVHACEAVVSKFYPPDRTLLAAFPTVPRHAGPREALFHAITHKNYGINRMLIGWNHAGAAAFYGPREAQEIFEQFPVGEIGVAPLKLEHTFFCRGCDSQVSLRTCPHDASLRVELTDAQVRETLRSGGHLPREFSRAEVGEILRAHFVSESGALPPPPKHEATRAAGGFILWFTGLSGAGKSTLANAIRHEIALERPLEILDGDEVRTYLSKGLGFSKEDRDTNVRRIGYVARLLARNGTPVVTAAISPYAETRHEVRKLAEADGVPFIEVYAQASIEALAARDVKGLYKRALAGEIAHFTGVSDVYEPPTNPELIVHTDRDPISTSLQQILDLLRTRGLLDAARKAA